MRSVEHQGRLVRLLAARTGRAAAGFLIAGVVLLAAPIPAVAATLSVSSTTMAEDGGSVTATLDDPNLNLCSITIGGTATEDTDYSVSSDVLFGCPVTVTITGLDDSEVDPDETISISGYILNPGGQDISLGPITVTITDDDVRGVTVSPASLDIDEGDSESYTVELDTQPTGTVTVAVTSDHTDVSVSPASLTFTATNWDTAQTVTVETEEDDDAADETAELTNNPSGADYGAVASATVDVTVDDGDVRGVTVSPASLDIDEGESDDYTVKLDSQPTGTVTVTVSSDHTDVSVSPASLTFTATNWDTAQTVTVSGVEDAGCADESATVSNTPSGADYDEVTAATVSVTVTDDDICDPVFSSASVAVEEGDTATYNVKLSTQPTGNVTVAVASSDTDAAGVSPSSLTFTTSNWSTWKTVTVSGVEDAACADESATLEHSASGGGYGGADGDVEVTVTDDDNCELVFDPSSVSVEEDDTATYNVKLSTQPTGNVTVDVESSDTDAAGVSPSSLTFTTSNWSTWKTVTVSGVEDAACADESATLEHSASGGGYGGADGDVEVTVTDDDNCELVFDPSSVSVEEDDTATYNVKLSTQPTGNVTVDVESSDTGAAGVSPSSLTFTATNWSTWKTVTVSGVEDAACADESATLEHSASGGGYGGADGDVEVTVTDDDNCELVFDPSSVSVEEGDTATYNVKLSTQPTGNVTVAVASSDTDAAGVSPSSLTFTATNWSTWKTVTVSGVEDAACADESATLEHSASGGGYGGADGDVAVSVTDDDECPVVFSSTNVSVEEGDTATYSVRLPTQPTGNVTVDVESSDTDAAGVSPSSLTFTTSNWSTWKTVTVSGVEDAACADESATLEHSASGGGYGGADGDVEVTVTDDDNCELVFDPSSVSVEEDDTATYNVKLSTQPTGNVTVDVESSDTGAAGVSPSSLTFTATNWSTWKTVTVSGVEDAACADESATLEHSASGGGYGGADGDVEVTVTDDDNCELVFDPSSVSVEEGDTATYNVKLSTQPTGNVTVAVASSDTDAAGVSPSSLTFTATNWSTWKTVTVSGVEDAACADESATLEHSASGGGYGGADGDVAVSVTDDDECPVVFSSTNVSVEEGDTATYSVRLPTEPTGNVTVAVASSDTGAAGVSPSSLTFTATNWSTWKTVTVSGVEDAACADESATLEHSASGGGYGGADGDVEVTVTDDDNCELVFDPSSVSVEEGDTATYNVKLSTQPTGNVTVAVASSDTDAAGVSPSSLTFTATNWSTWKTVTVSGVEDAACADESATLEHSASGGGYGGADGDVAVSVTDDDECPVVFSSTNVSVEEGDTATYSVRLPTEPTGNVTVAVASSDTDAAGVSPSSLTFTTSNWSTWKTVTVSGVEDAACADESATLEHSASGGGYGGADGDVEVTVTDDDNCELVFDPSSVSVEEDDTATYNVKLSTQPTGTVTVDVESSDTGAAGVSPSSLTFTATNWSTWKTVTVSGVEDAACADESATLEHSASGGGYGGADGDVAVSVTDDDECPVVFSSTNVSVEEGDTATYSVRLPTEPTGNVTVAVASSDTDAAGVSPSSLTFTTSNWSTWKTVTVSGVEDAACADESATLEHSASGGGYGGADGDVEVTVTDDDNCELVFDPSSVSVEEDDTATYNVKLSTQPTGNVTVDVASSDTDAAGVSPSSLTFTTSNWSTWKTVTVSGVEDAGCVDESLAINHTAAGGGYDGVTGAVSVTVIDDDTCALVFDPSSVSVDEDGTVTYKAKLSTQPTGTVTVGVASSDTGAAGVSPSSLTFTTSNWSTWRTVTVSGVEDAGCVDESLAINHTAAGGGYDGVTGAVSVTVIDDDTCALVFDPSSVSVDEDGTVTYKAKLSTQPTGTVTVGVASSDTGAAGVSTSSLAFTTSNWNTPQTVTVSGVEDAGCVDESLAINHTAAGGGYDGVTGAVSVTVIDDDTCALVFDPSSVSVDEDGTVTYKAKLSTQPTGTVTVGVASSDTGAAGVSTSSLAFTTSNWNTPQTVTVSGVEDAGCVDESLAINHTASGGGFGGADGDVDVTVTDDDDCELVFSSTDVDVEEGDTATYNVKLSTQPTGTVTVGVASSDTGAAGVSPSSLTFTTDNWNTWQTVTVSGVEDADGLDESVTLSHSATGGGFGGASGTVTVAVSDDVLVVSIEADLSAVEEGADATFTLSRTGSTAQDLTVNVSVKETGDMFEGTPPSTVTIPQDESTATLTVATDNDSLDEFDSTITAAIVPASAYEVGSSGSATITGNDNDPEVTVSLSSSSAAVGEEAGTAELTVHLSTASGKAVTVEYATTDGTASSASDADYTAVASGTLTFAEGDTEKTIEVTITEDAIDEDNETFTVTLSNPENATLGSTDEATVTITDDDTRGVTVSPTSLTIDEGGSGSYTVVLTSAPANGGTVTVAPVATFTSSNWNIPQTVTVYARQDDDAADETATLSHTVSGADYDGVAADSVALTIIDDDIRGVTVAPTSLAIDEGGSGSYTVVLDTAPTDGGTVSLTVSSDHTDVPAALTLTDLSWDPAQTDGGTVTVSVTSDHTGVTVSPATLTFTASNWDDAQTVTVSAEEDDDADDDTATLSHAVSGADYGSNEVTADSVAVTVTDDDTRGVTVLPTSLKIDEGASGRYTMVLDTQPTGDVTVSVTSDHTGVTVSSATLTFSTSNWDTAQTVTVSAAQDDDAEDATATVSHTVSGADYDGVAADAVAVTVDDDETPSTTVTLAVSPAAVDESAGATTVTVTGTLDAAPFTQDTVVSVTESPGTATPGSDYRPGAATLTIAAGDTSGTATLTFKPVDDAVDESDETVIVKGETSGLPVTPATLTITDDDTRGVTVTPVTLTIDEGGSGRYTVVLDSAPADGRTVPVTVTVASDHTGVTASPATLTFTTSNWDTAQTVTVSAAQDDDADDDTATLSHAVSGADYGASEVTADPVAVTVTDDDTRGVTVLPTSLTIDEGGSGRYTMVLDTRPTDDVTVTVTSDHTGVTASASTLTFTASNWDTAQTVTVSAAQDDDAEDATATVSHTVSGADYDDVAADSVAVTVDDDETPSTTVTLAVSPAAVDESAGATTVTVTGTLDAAPFTQDTVVSVTESPGTATPGSDYRPGAATLTIAAGDTSGTATLTFKPVDDAVDESDETVIVKGETSGLPVTPATLTITDDDTRGVTVTPVTLTIDEGGSGRYTVVLDSAPADGRTVPVTVTVASDHTGVTASPATLTFTTSNWDTAQTVTVSAAQDDDADDDTATLSHAVSGADYGASEVTADPVAVTVTDDDTRGVTVLPTSLTIDEGGSGRYTMVLDTRPTDDVTVTVTSDHTGVTASASTLTFTASNWDTAQTVTVSAAQDDDAEDATATVSHTVSGADYDDVAADSVAVTVDDDETPSTTVTLAVSPAAVDESAGATTVTVTGTLDAAPFTQDTVVSVTESPGTATPGSDYRPGAATLTIAAGDTSGTATLTFKPVDDAVDESDETVIVKGETSGLPVTPATLTITDDDTRGVTVTPVTLTIDEGGSGRYTVVLDSAPADGRTVPVTVTVASDHTGVTASPATLTFTTSNWDTAQAVTVSAAQDDDADDGTATLSHAVSGADYGSNEVTADSVAVTVTDDDTRGVTVTPTSLTIDEGASGSYTVVLNTQPTGDVTVSATVEPAAMLPMLTITTLTFTASNWDTAQTVTLSGGQDTDAVDETATVSHAVSGADYGANAVTADSVAVTVIDDDVRAVTVSPTSLAIDEGASDDYTVVLDTQPTGDVTVTVTSDHTNVTGLPATLTFTDMNWSAAQTVTVSAAQDDDVDDGTATLSHAVSGADYGANEVTADSVAVTVTDDDVRGVTVTPTSLTIPEGGSGSYTVVLDTRPTGDVTVSATVEPAAMLPMLTITTLTFTASNWDTAQTVTLSGGQDTDADDETATLSHAVSGADYDEVTADSVSVTVIDDDTRGVTVTPATLAIDEGASGDYTVVLDTQPTGDVTVALTSDHTGVTGSPATLTFTEMNWSVAQTVTVSAAQDDDADDETATLSHAVSGADYGSNDVTAESVAVTVTDVPLVSLSSSPVSVDEDAGTVALTANLSRASSEAVTVSYATADGTATAGSDYPVSTGTLTIAAGDTSGTISVSITEDDVDEDDETFTVSLSNPENATLGSPASSTVTIIDDDTHGVTVTPVTLTIDEGGSGSYTVVLDTQPTGDVTVTVTSDHTDVTTAASTLTFTTSNWDTAQTVTVSAAQDDDAVNDTATLSHAVSGADYDEVTADSVAVTVTDNDDPSVSLSSVAVAVSEDAGSVALTASLSQSSSEAVTVSYATANDTATAGTDYTAASGTLTIAAGDTSGTISVSITEDGVDEDDETFTVSLSNPENATLGSPASSTVTITDDDTRGVTVSPTSLTIDEGGSGSYTVVLDSQPTGDVTVSATVEPAAMLSMLTVATLTFTASNWDTAQTVTLSGGQDTDADDETATLSHAVSGADYGSNAVTADSVSVTVIDDDTRGVTVTPATLAIDEGASGDYTVVLDTQPTDDVTVALTSDHTGVTGSPATLTFTEMNWSVAQTVTVSAAQDDDADDETATLSHAVSGADYGSNAVTADSVAVTVTDDDPSIVAVCDRTAEVRDAIVAASPVSACGDVTATHLAAITSLSLRNDGISALQVGDFSGLTGLSTLELQRNELTTLPAEVFDELSALTTLELHQNDLSSLPAGVFDGLSALTTLVLRRNELTTLPAGVFDELSALTTLELHQNDLSSLPAGVFDGLSALTTLVLRRNELTTLPAGVFDELSALTTLELHQNDLSSLPAGVFDGLSALSELQLHHNDLSSLPAGLFSGLAALAELALHSNATNPLDLTVSLEKVGDDQFKAVAPAGAPFELVLPVSVSGPGSIDGGATTVTIAAGALESSTLTVSRNTGTTADVTADLGTLPGLPTNHGGYALVKSADLPLEVLAEVEPGISVDDAQAEEGSDATIDFTVNLSHAASAAVTVAYATADGSAQAGEDYTSASGTLTFSAGETEKTVSVTVLDDAVDEGEETFTLDLSNATGATITDAQATGTISNSDPLPQAWLTRFGRTVAGHVTEALSERLTESERAGSQVTLGGVRLPLGEDARPSTREPGFGTDPGAGLRPLTRSGRFGGPAPHAAPWDSEQPAAHAGASGERTLRDWLLGSSFRVALKRNEDDPASSRWTAWGNGMASRFDGNADGLDVDGEVTTFTLGADRAWDRWLAGVAVARSSGSGGFADRAPGAGSSGRGSGDLDSTLTSVHPYVRFALSERLSAWGLLGYGRGKLTLDREHSGTWRTDTAMRMAAAGGRGVLAPAAFTGGFEWAVRSDVLFTQMTSQAVETAAGRLAGSEGGTSRLRLILEGARTWTLQRSRTLTPSVELGLKHDGGDAETGMGVEIGGGLRFVDPGMGLSVEVKARGLLAHQDADYREWGASAAIQLDPGASGRGLVLALTPSWGVHASGVEQLWSLRNAQSLTGNGDFAPAGRLEAELGYMLDGPRSRGVQTPYAAWSLGDAGDRTLRVGWRLAMGPDSTLRLEGMKRQPANGNPAEHGVLLRGSMRW